MPTYKYVDWPGLQYYHSKVTELIDTRLNGSIKFGGEVNFEDLPSPDYNDVNTLYRVINTFSVPIQADWFDSSMWNITYPKGTVLQVTQTDDGIYYKVFLIPIDSIFDRLSNYYTAQEIDNLFSNVLLQLDKKVNYSDLVDYTTTEFVENKLSVITTELETLSSHVENNYIRIDEGVTKQELSTTVQQEVEAVVSQELDDTIAEKVTEAVDSGVEVTSVSYGEF